MLQLAFRCPLCGEPFQVAQVHEGQAVECPHCRQAVAIPRSAAAGTDAAPPSAACAPEADPIDRTAAKEALARPGRTDREAPPLPRASPDRMGAVEREGPALVASRGGDLSQGRGEAYVVRSLTRQERAAFRRRVNLFVFAVTAAILALAVAALLLWRG